MSIVLMIWNVFFDRGMLSFISAINEDYRCLHVPLFWRSWKNREIIIKLYWGIFIDIIIFQIMSIKVQHLGNVFCCSFHLDHACLLVLSIVYLTSSHCDCRYWFNLFRFHVQTTSYSNVYIVYWIFVYHMVLPSTLSYSNYYIYIT